MAHGGDIAWLALLALGRIAAAAGTPAPAPGGGVPIRVEVDAPAGCSSAEAFIGGVLGRSERARRAGPHEGGVRLQVRLARDGGKVLGELRVVDGASATDTRKVQGSTCGEVVGVLSLTAALAIDGVGRPSGAAGAPAAATGGAAPPAATTTTTATASPSTTSPAAANAPTAASVPAAAPGATPAEPAPPGAPVTSGSGQAAPARSTPVPTPRDPARARPAREGDATAARAAPETPPAAPPGPVGIELGARVMAAALVSPYVNVGGGLVARVARRAPDTLVPSLALGLLYVPNDSVQPGDAVVVRWTALALTGCPGWGLRRPIRVEPCAQAIGGWLWTTDRGITNARSVSHSWWSAGGLVRAAAELGAGFTLELDAGVTVPFERRRFITTTPARNVAETTSIAVLFGLGVVRAL